VLPTQGIEKEPVLLNADSWSALNIDSETAKTNSLPSSPDLNVIPKSPTNDPLWNEFKNRKALTMQREKERFEAEEAKRQQLLAMEEAEKKTN